MRSGLAVLAMGLGLAVGASADAAYSFTFGQASYDLQGGEFCRVPVYLLETGTTNLQSLGLSGMGLVLQQENPLATPAAVFSAATLEIADAFVGGSTAASEAGGAEWASNPTAAKLAGFPLDIQYADSTGQILLGWVGFTAGNAAGSTTFQALDDAGSLDNMLGDYATRFTVGSGSVEINVVPEAATVGLMCGALPLILRRRRNG